MYATVTSAAMIPANKIYLRVLAEVPCPEASRLLAYAKALGVWHTPIFES